MSQLPDGLIHVEGGPTLNAALLTAGVVDAINLTMSPHVGGHRGASITQPPHTLREFTLASVNTQDNFVFLRYEKRTA